MAKVTLVPSTNPGKEPAKILNVVPQARGGNHLPSHSVNKPEVHPVQAPAAVKPATNQSKQMPNELRDIIVKKLQDMKSPVAQSGCAAKKPTVLATKPCERQINPRTSLPLVSGCSGCPVKPVSVSSVNLQPKCPQAPKPQCVKACASPAAQPVQVKVGQQSGSPAIGTGFTPGSDYTVRRHKVQMAPDHKSYETIDTTEVRRTISMMPRPSAQFGAPPPLPFSLMKALSGSGMPYNGPKPMFAVLKKVAGAGPVATKPTITTSCNKIAGTPVCRQAVIAPRTVINSPDRPILKRALGDTDNLRKVIQDKITHRHHHAKMVKE